MWSEEIGNFQRVKNGVGCSRGKERKFTRVVFYTQREEGFKKRMAAVLTHHSQRQSKVHSNTKAPWS